MERFIGVEEARAQLGELAEEVAGGGDPVVLAKRGKALAVVIGRDEYARLKENADRLVRAELQERLMRIRDSIRKAGLGSEVVDEAIKAARDIA
ncbi:MAG: type II toxin-antitoxin system Phd/YefM family antitoxin [Actinomycetota bacterium]